MAIKDQIKNSSKKGKAAAESPAAKAPSARKGKAKEAAPAPEKETASLPKPRQKGGAPKTQEPGQTNGSQSELTKGDAAAASTARLEGRSTKIVPIKEITIGRRMTEPTEDQIRSLADSIDMSGLETPITLRRLPNQKLELVTGMSRLKAVQMLGWEGIEAFVYADMTDEEARLWEIEENLARRKLTASQEALQTAARKTIYEKIFPETRRGAISAKLRMHNKGKATLPKESFHKTQQKLTGKSKSSIMEAAQLGKDLGENILKKIEKTSLDNSHEMRALAKLPAARRDAVVKRAAAGEKVSAKAELKKHDRELREAALAANQKELPKKKYGVILADPPWTFQPWSEETGQDRAAANHYRTMSADDIASLPIGDLAADDCVLFLWATAPMLIEAFSVMRIWGFKYVSGAVWDKTVQGTGFWFRSQHEHLLVGTKGKIPAPAQGDQWGSVFASPRREHSRKPDEVYDCVEAYYPNLPKIELFARHPREGWESWGDEAPEVETSNTPESGSDRPASSMDQEHDADRMDDREEDGTDDNYTPPTPTEDSAEKIPGYTRRI